MLYAVFCYNREEAVDAWPKEKDEAVMAKHAAAMKQLAARSKLGPAARLMNTSTATTLRTDRETVLLDGPFAETKEQLLGFYVLDCDSLEEAIEAAKNFTVEGGALEIRPVRFFELGSAVR
ncbi:MAG TPA: YciI family protein [Steroidobacter sp.]|jgi:hypothetical protein|nr:YciI family protein [Steroidobacter sp.]